MSQAAARGGAGLWRHRDFLKLWGAQSVSSFGARITREGLAFAAVMSLGASPAQVGVLAALARGPAIVVGLMGGGLVDRGRRRPILIWTDVGRAMVLASIPVAAWLHIFSMVQLYIVAALVGGLSVLFDMADHAYLPFLIARSDLVEGNAKLATTESIAEIGGPSLAGLLFQVFTAPFAIAVNAGTYLVSALVLATIRAPEPAPAPSEEAPTHPIADFKIGLVTALAHPVIRPLLLIACASALFGSFFSALYILFALRVLGLTPAMLGATISVGGVAALLGASLARALIQRFGIGPTFVYTGIVTGLGSLFIPLAHGGPVIGMVMLMASQAVGDSFGTVNEIAGRSLRQTQAPPEMMGRIGGVFAAAPGATGIIGAVVGGVLGGVLGPQHTLLIASAGVIVSPALGYFSALRTHTETTVAEED